MTTVRPTTLPSGELRALTGLRIVAAVWVVLFHFHFTPLPAVADAVGVLGPLITSGALGVDLFFVLSGFVIAHTYLDRLGPALRLRETGRFVWARACRIWPAYVLVFNLFGVWLVARLVFGNDGNIAFQSVQPVVGFGEWLQQLFMVQLWDNAYFDGASWVGPTWSISAEWLAYVLFPLAALGFFRLRNLPAPVLALGALALMTPIALAYLQAGNPYFPFSWAVRILCGFAAGVLMLLAVRRVRGGSTTNRRASLLAALLPVVMAAGLLLGELAGEGRGGAVIVLFPLLVGALALADRGPAMLLATPWAVTGGRISFALYLVHIPLFEIYWLAQQKIEWLGGASGAANLVALGVLASSMVAAGLVYVGVEEPARRQLRRLAEPSGRRRSTNRVSVGRWPLGRTATPGKPAEPAEDEPAALALPEPTVPGDLAQEPANAGIIAMFQVARASSSDEPRHAATSSRPPTLADALLAAQRRHPSHRADVVNLAERVERAAMVRIRTLHAGS